MPEKISIHPDITHRDSRAGFGREPIGVASSLFRGKGDKLDLRHITVAREKSAPKHRRREPNKVEPDKLVG